MFSEQRYLEVLQVVPTPEGVNVVLWDLRSEERLLGRASASYDASPGDIFKVSFSNDHHTATLRLISSADLPSDIEPVLNKQNERQQRRVKRVFVQAPRSNLSPPQWTVANDVNPDELIISDDDSTVCTAVH